MENWTISKRMSALIALGVAAFMMVAIVSLGGQWMLSSTFKGFSGAGDQTLTANRVRDDILEAEALAKDFKSTGDANLIPVMEEKIEDVLRQTGTEKSDNLHPEIVDIYINIHDLALEYRQGFDQVVELQGQRNQHVSEMLTAGQAARQFIDELTSLAYVDGKFPGARMSSNAIRDLVLSRLYMERFLLNNDADDFEQAQTWLASASTSLERAGRLLTGDRFATDRLGAEEAFKDFAIASRTVFETIIARNQARDRVRSIGLNIVSLSDDALAAATLEQQTLAATNRRTQIIVVAVLAAIVAGSLGAMLWFGRRFSSAVRCEIDAIVADMSRIADGKLDIAIAGLERMTEVGDMARALEVFRQNAIAAEEVSDELRAKDEQDKRRKEAEEARAKEAESERQAALESERKLIIADLSEALGGVVRAAAQGDFSKRINRSFEDDELASIAQAINEFVERVELSLGETARVLHEVASGDLTERMQGDFQGLFADLRDALGTTTDTLSTLVQEIRQQSEDIGDNAGLMSERADDLATRAEHQAATLEQTSAAMKELSGTVNDSAEAARKSVDVATQATEKADAAGDVVSSAITAMTDIREASDKINEIVSVMESIAFQTNLLALNASVEAARAGSAGKGFAVVATEVRALAQRSGDASKDIKELIDATSAQVDRGVGLVERTGETLGEVVEGVRDMAKTLEGLTATAQEQATGIGQVASAVTELDAITQKNAAVADESRVAAVTLGRQMEVLNGMVNRFRIDGRATNVTRIAAE